MLQAWKGRNPEVHPSVYLAEGCVLIGGVTIGESSSVWHYAVLRADLDAITIGRASNIQDLSCIHCVEGGPTVIGDQVTVGHGAVLHACHIGNRVVVGMKAVVLDGAVVEDNCVIGAGAVVSPGARIGRGSLALGVPARVVRTLSEREIERITRSAETYAALASEAVGRR
jgi:carbonic anhydrase/acetyltransferase-like protein (isoleucine patch superfamily)